MEKQSYFCIFDTKKLCPVKKEFKLKPESLVEFCNICKAPTTGIKIEELQIIMGLVKEYGQLQKGLGQKTAEAEIFKGICSEPRRSPPLEKGKSSGESQLRKATIGEVSRLDLRIDRLKNQLEEHRRQGICKG